MSETLSFKEQLTQYRKHFLQQPKSLKLRFTALGKLYEYYANHAKDLSLLIYSTAITKAELQYGELKEACRNEHQQLKHLQKELDNSSLMVEQQLYLGLPDDLKEMEKIINAQEAILAEQQRINLLEEQLLERMRLIDIDHGKKLAAIEQAAVDRIPPIHNEKQALDDRLAEEAKKITLQTRVLSILPILLIPIILDVIAQRIGIQNSSSSQLIFSHYIFLISFILMEIFVSSWIKDIIATKLSSITGNQLIIELESKWLTNQEQIKLLEQKYATNLASIKSKWVEKVF